MRMRLEEELDEREYLPPVTVALWRPASLAPEIEDAFRAFSQKRVPRG